MLPMFTVRYGNMIADEAIQGVTVGVLIQEAEVLAVALSIMAGLDPVRSQGLDHSSQGMHMRSLSYNQYITFQFYLFIDVAYYQYTFVTIC